MENVNFCYDCQRHVPSEDPLASDYCGFLKAEFCNVTGDAKECRNKLEKGKGSAELLTISEFTRLCQESVNPDLYSTLIDDIIPALRDARAL